jgi:CBS domain-containing protein
MNDDVTLRDVMAREFVGVNESDPVAGAAALLSAERADAAVVLRGSEPVGVFSARDVVEVVAAGDDPGETPVSAVMSPPVALPSGASLADAMEAMADRDVTHVVVTDAEDVAGTVEARDVVAAAAALRGEREPVAGPGAEGDGGRADATDAFADQSICEVCGSLARTLTNVNGQLVCSDCREF